MLNKIERRQLKTINDHLQIRKRLIGEERAKIDALQEERQSLDEGPEAMTRKAHISIEVAARKEIIAALRDKMTEASGPRSELLAKR